MYVLASQTDESTSADFMCMYVYATSIKRKKETIACHYLNCVSKSLIISI